MRVAVLQSSYLPWLGFFEQMHKADIFVLYDDVQYTRNDWRNRNRIKGPNGLIWLTVPVRTTGRFGQRICEAEIDNSQGWAAKHWRTMQACYARAPHYAQYADDLHQVYERPWVRLCDLNDELIRWSCEKVQLERTILRSSHLDLKSTDRNLRLLEIYQKLSATAIYEGRLGRQYMDRGLFETRGIMVEFQDYHHPYYHQLWPKHGFISHLSIIDLLFNHGPESLAVLVGDRRLTPPPEMRILHADALRIGQ